MSPPVQETRASRYILNSSRRRRPCFCLPRPTHTRQGAFHEARRDIEIPKGSRVKYEVDHETGRVRLDRVLFTSMQYPTHYGFFENTLGEDGDPLDALVLLQDFDLHPGVIVESRPIGVFNMTDDGGGDAKVLCVPADARFDHINEIGDVSEFLIKEIEHFFTRYKDLEPGKWVKAEGWMGRAEAEAELERSVERYKAQA